MHQSGIMSVISIKETTIDSNTIPSRFNILGLPVDALNMGYVLAEINRLVSTSNRANYIVAGNPEKVYALRGNAFLREFFKDATLVIPDGIGVVWALRWIYGQRVQRVPGADLMQTICAVAPERGYRIFIYGAAEEVSADAVLELQRRYPGIQIVGRANGYVKEPEMLELIQKINELHPDILFVALGSPKQEEWLHRWLPELNVKVCQGIGGTLDTIVGKVKRAPLGWQRLGLEWFYRLLRQPSRAFRQLVLLKFVWEVMIKK
jgi:N-acetylglucosaminyldiphosphoundecaprenol N-acetyl-beta-D-mannosaminyltransferase